MAANGQHKIINNELKNPDKLQKIKLAVSEPNCSTYKSDSLLLSICRQPFDRSKHHIQYDGRFVSKIDNKHPYGVDGALPKHEIKSIILKIGTTQISIPKSAYQNLFEPSLLPREQAGLGDLSLYRSKDGKRLYIMMQNSDGAGFYIVTFIIVGKKYYDRKIEDDF